jgi:hypothetical protein
MERERCSWINIQALQVPETGEFPEGTHFVLHPTAHCIAALELIARKPLYSLRSRKISRGRKSLSPAGKLDWLKNPWNDSHIGSGRYASLVLSGMADSQ